MKRRLSRGIEPGADGVEFSPEDPQIPIAFRIWREGVNQSDKGPVTFNAVSRTSVIDRYLARGMAVVLDYDHESTVEPERRPTPGATGYGCSSGRCALELRGGELWAVRVAWTDRAAEQIRRRERTQISPYFATDDAGVIVELLNIALCTEGATHRGADFAARLRRLNRSIGMKEMIAQLRATLEAIQAGGAGTIDEALAQLSQLEAVAAAAEGAPVDDMMAEDMKRMGADVEEVKQQVSRVLARLASPAPQAHGRAPALSADVIACRRERVGIILEKLPEGTISPDTARFLEEQGDPEIAKRFTGELLRLGRERPNSGAKPPADPGAGHLTDAERAAARRSGMTDQQFVETRRLTHSRAAAKGGR